VPKLKNAIAVREPFEPKRGRPTAHQSAAIERVIHEAAATAFLSMGYERTSMEAVAADAGVPKSTLYKRFPDKRSLLRAVLSDRVSAWGELERVHDPDDDLERRLKHLAAAILRHAATPEVRAFCTLVSAAWSGPGEARERQEVIGYAKMMARIAQEIREFGPSSGIFARDSQQVAIALMAMLGGWIEYIAPTSENPDEAAEHFAHASVEILMRGVVAW
jgi:AcrR family transcriptional regulator